ncbi:MAG: heavy-metal-associated domain-containing protein [Armatimonadota bacterium]
MKTLLWISLIVSLALVSAQAYAADGCCAPPATQAGGQTLPAENLLTLTGMVVSLGPGGLALVDIGTAKVYVANCPAPTQGGTAPASPFKVGDRVQVAGVLMALSVQPAPEQGQAAPADATLQQAIFKVSNILCGMCSQSVQKALQATAGVTQVNVTEAGIATVTYDPAKTTVEALAKAITHAKHPHGMVFKATLQQ